MKNNIKKSSIALAIVASLTLAACGSDDKNSAPTASDLVLNLVSSNSVVTFTDAELIALSEDADGDAISVDSVTVTTGTGTLTQSSGGWSYFPAAQEVGPVELAYVVSDGAATGTANVVFTLIDPSVAVVDANGIVTVTGKVIDAVTRLPVASAVVSMMVNGGTHTAYSSASGDYTFKQVTDGTAYSVEVMDSAGVYAVEAAQATTPTAVANVANQVLAQTVPDFELHKAVATSITVKNVNGGASVEGLSLYFVINGKTVLATETAAGVYTFNLADDGNAQAILSQKIVDSNGDVFEPSSATVMSPNFANLTPGNDITYYVKSADKTEFTVYFHVVDDEGHPLDVGSFLTLDEGGMPAYADRKADTTNEYVHTVTAATMGNNWLIEPIDMDGDGFPDYTANYTNKAGNTNDSEIALGVNNELNRGSFDANREATLVVPLTPVSYNETIQAEIISSDDNFQTNGLAEVIIAFDRPIELIHQPRMSYQVLSKKDIMRGVEDPAGIFQTDFLTAATTNQGETSLVLNTDEDYEYLDKDGNTQKVALADDNAEIKSPYADDYDSNTSTVVDLTSAEYMMTAGNTLLKITLDAATLKAHQIYTFDLAVKGMLDDNPIAMMSFNKTAKTSATATLDTIMVDNFDYKQTATKDLLDATKELDITDQKGHVSKFSTLNVGYATGGLTDFAQLRYLTYGLDGGAVAINTIEPAAIDHSLSTLFIVSPAKLEGSLQILSQTEKYTDNGAVVQATFGDTGKFYRLDLAAQDINDNGDLADLTLINSTKTYLLQVPANHGINNSGAGLGVFATSPASGADIATEGVYYVYPLTVPTMSGFGDAYVDSVELDFNVSVNGAALTGKKTYVVK